MWQWVFKCWTLDTYNSYNFCAASECNSKFAITTKVMAPTLATTSHMTFLQEHLPLALLMCTLATILLFALWRFQKKAGSSFESRDVVKQRPKRRHSAILAPF